MQLIDNSTAFYVRAYVISAEGGAWEFIHDKWTNHEFAHSKYYHCRNALYYSKFMAAFVRDLWYFMDVGLGFAVVPTSQFNSKKVSSKRCTRIPHPFQTADEVCISDEFFYTAPSLISYESYHMTHMWATQCGWYGYENMLRISDRLVDIQYWTLG